MARNAADDRIVIDGRHHEEVASLQQATQVVIVERLVAVVCFKYHRHHREQGTSDAFVFPTESANLHRNSLPCRVRVATGGSKRPA
ncbi:MAG: hypothetical protein MUF34_32215, partial [Polyangiaceae bacterium]|nr:hypothetical protein [Polyangiaceae bacterium]